MSILLRNFVLTSSGLIHRHCLQKPVLITVYSKTNRISSSSIFYSTVKNLDANTNVAKDVILFRYENPRFYKYLNIFAITQFVFWSFLGFSAYSSLRDVPVKDKDDPDKEWWQKVNLGEKKYRNGLAAFSLLCGWGVLALSWLYTLRTVRYLILNKGGKKVSFVTYAPFGENRIMTVPLTDVSTTFSRSSAKIQMPIKVKHKALNFVLDMRGEFKNPQLFDLTAGLKRNLKK